MGREAENMARSGAGGRMVDQCYQESGKWEIRRQSRKGDVSVSPSKESVKNVGLFILFIAIIILLIVLLWRHFFEGGNIVTSLFSQLMRLTEPRYS